MLQLVLTKSFRQLASNPSDSWLPLAEFVASLLGSCDRSQTSSAEIIDTTLSLADEVLQERKV